MTDTTSIEDLPTNPNASNNNNVVLNTTEKQVTYSPDVKTEDGANNKMPSPEEQKIMNTVVTDIQQAKAAGQTSLPSRDIPLDTHNIIQDEQIKANFVPKGPQDYIQEHETTQDMLKENLKDKNRKDSLEVVYEELQMPIMLGVLFFSISITRYS